MGRLSPDCFDAAPALMRVADAVAPIRDRLPVLSGIETADLPRADGRVLAGDLVAPIDLPPSSAISAPSRSISASCAIRPPLCESASRRRRRITT
ncbi:hypothetical protein [Methylobacterium sp. PvR107]|uniref:hypothetical protein n=1 Tax=Methylobacterium sp. PvR107 TaxID=2806597 RepID=UPI001B433EAF|nr:hypothetical protein [Methylobacterium sp. PvR107]MBP1182323.1 hypothetical protein [Methylobacterium sp. PvR107]